MDPNAALAALRAALTDYRAAEEDAAAVREPIGVTTEAADQLADGFEALDEWLSRGGFLPEAWTPGSSPAAATSAYGDVDHEAVLVTKVRRAVRALGPLPAKPVFVAIGVREEEAGTEESTFHFETLALVYLTDGEVATVELDDATENLIEIGGRYSPGSGAGLHVHLDRGLVMFHPLLSREFDLQVLATGPATGPGVRR